MKSRFITTTILSFLTIVIMLSAGAVRADDAIPDQIKLMAGTWTLSTKGITAIKGGDATVFTQTITLNFLTKDAGDNNIITGKTFGNEIVKSSISTAERNGKVAFKTSHKFQHKYYEIKWEGTLDTTAKQITNGKFSTPYVSGSFTAVKN